MHEIDLTPADYRSHRLVARWIKTGILGIVLITTLSIGAFGYLYLLKHSIDSEILDLQVKKDISNKQRQELKLLQTRQDKLRKQWQLLASLRHGSAIESIFKSIDNALTENDVWFIDWKFKRAGALAQDAKGPGRAGYFIIIPAKDGASENQTWKIDTHMTIRGEALDYSALSGFVARLIDQPEIEDVRVLRSILKKQQKRKLVEFNLAVTVANGIGHS